MSMDSDRDPSLSMECFAALYFNAYILYILSYISHTLLVISSNMWKSRRRHLELYFPPMSETNILSRSMDKRLQWVVSTPNFLLKEDVMINVLISLVTNHRITVTVTVMFHQYPNFAPLHYFYSPQFSCLKPLIVLKKCYAFGQIVSYCIGWNI